ncbi:hypothetical protein [Sphingopyxis sp. GW247-27LB]|uniref:hypothetical protein n=1 Tax=Sphingopyxis sp. GW247-27LB TaxID=2012632 RepID=UPI001140CFD3|nr:hypothetical protein [Sphingopyxis sp. GW247-27LB]
MQHSFYQSHLRPDREYLDFQRLPLLESSADRRRREEARRRARSFTAGAAAMALAIALLVIML